MLFKGRSSKLEDLIKKIHRFQRGEGGSSGWSGISTEGSGSGSGSPGGSIADPDLQDRPPPYHCSFCDKSFARLSYLKKHEQSHGEEMPFKCSFCQRLFKHKRSRDRHIKLHTGDKKYRCHQCDAAFSRRFVLHVGPSDHLKIHVKTHDTGKPFQCTHCNRGYNTAAALTSHMQNHKQANRSLPNSSSPGMESTRETSSPITEQNQDSTEGIEEKAQEEAPTSNGLNGLSGFPCALCPTGFPSIRDVQKHLVMEHNFLDVFPWSLMSTPTAAEVGRTWLCNQCNEGFRDFESFRTHLGGHLESTRHKSLCFECHQEFPDQDSLDSHMVSHYLASTTEYGCQSCQKLFLRPDDLQKHLMDIHALHLYKCSLCQGVFDSKVAIQVHFAVEHSDECKLLKCVVCGAGYKTEAEFHVHVRANHLKKLQPLKCLLCNASFVSPDELHAHVRVSHRREFRCQLCPQAFHVEFLLDRHIETCHQVQNMSAFKCEHCDLDFQSESALSQHRRELHGNRMRTSQSVSLFCAYCNENCKTRSELETHMKGHNHQTGNGKHKCNICDEVYPTAQTLAQHRLVHCQVTTGSTCVTCKVTLGTEQDFLAHQGQHHGMGFPTPCIICRQSLASKAELELHARFHLRQLSRETRPEHVCGLCGGVAFETEQRLQLHLIEHAFEGCAAFTCPMCGSMFTTSAGLHAHLPSHDGGSKPYPCRACPQAFHVGAELENHVALRHEAVKAKVKEQTHLCPVCARTFAKSRHAREHLHTHFSEKGRFRCPDCDRSGEDLLPHTEHMRYQCPRCSSFCKGLDELKLHLRVVHSLDVIPVFNDPKSKDDGETV
ncbi:unnamed protein product [Darwinula stevensoni]|uniref:C2H2-type domain-containing protein n=1 Tax=Darwinula stevensoni TaxID=69355 RepID=A0A7R9A224_9CRUS|nr:unnamed protein product [Darwinula stevensoni]CAG0878681.1 unnamed protein product [Darwinula stevensoni]